MSLTNQTTEQKFPYAYDAVFDGLLVAIPQAGFILKSQDRTIGRITASTKMSLTSLGENLTIGVEKVDDKQTVMRLESRLKVFTNVAGAHRHAKNFDKLIAALSTQLQLARR